MKLKNRLILDLSGQQALLYYEAIDLAISSLQSTLNNIYLHSDKQDILRLKLDSLLEIKTKLYFEMYIRKDVY